uniref:Uncharacterized protein n=1 Tax=Macaca fascicularis TaxID=9541 RepID=Q9GMH9_MACFA|nr:hypothetical protein [Macaca fascicularis]
MRSARGKSTPSGSIPRHVGIITIQGNISVGTHSQTISITLFLLTQSQIIRSCTYIYKLPFLLTFNTDWKLRLLTTLNGIRLHKSVYTRE